MNTVSPRLNPFEFPGNTEFRLILLIVAVAGASLFIYGDFYNSVIWDQRGAFSPRYCALWMVCGSLVTLVLAVVLYWCWPRWIIQHGGLRSLTDRQSPNLLPYLHGLCQEVGLRRRPEFFWGVVDQTKEGYAFGRWGRLGVYLPDGLVRAFDDDLPAFRAIVLHELAHIFNGDVHRTYLCFATTRSFLLSALPVFLVALALSSWDRRLAMGVRVLLLVLLVKLTGNAVLRAREYYADLRASEWDKHSSALHLALESAAQSSGSKGLWSRLWLTHPDLGDRRRMIDDPSPLFAMGFWDGFATGLATMVPFTNFVALAGFTVLSTTADVNLLTGFLMFFLPALLFAVLVIYIIGAGTWRATFAALAQARPARGQNRLAIGLALGMVVGQQISFVGASKLLSNPLALVLWIGLLLVGLTGFFRWVALGATAWLPIAATHPSPRWFYRGGLAIAGVTLASLLVGLFMAFIAWNAQASASLIIAFNPFIAPALMGLWAYPLSAILWYPSAREKEVEPWLFLDPPGSPPRLLPLAPIKPLYAFGVGVGGGVVGALLIAALIPLGSDLIATVLMVSIGIQIVVAGGVAASVKAMGSIQGLFAASVAAMGVFWAVVVHTPLGLAQTLFLGTGLFTSGGLVSIPTVWVMAWVAHRLRRS